MENIKPFDHKPDKYGQDGRVVKRESYSCHIVAGAKYYNLPVGSDKFYTEGGQYIPIDEVPDVCKRNIGKQIKVKEVAGKIAKSGSEPKEPSSLV